MKCPRCGWREEVPILKGLPTVDAWEAEKRGELEIGGCEPGDERWACLSCRHRWS